MTEEFIEFKKEQEFSTIMFQNQMIRVKTYLTLPDAVNIISTYCTQFFDKSRPGDERVVLAEYSIKSTVFDLVADKKIKPEDFSEVVSTPLFDLVIAEVKNYNKILDIIHKTIDNMQKENSLDGKLSLLADKAMELVETLNKNGFDKDMLASMGNMVKEIQGLNLPQ